MNRASRRTRPDRPYRKVPVRRLLFECNRRLREARGPRAFELIAALCYRWPQVQSGIVYLGDSCLDAGREAHCCSSCRKQGRQACEHEHCCAARLMGRCGRTAHRAKYDLHAAGIVKLHGAGPGRCSCSRCGGEGAGGKILASRGEVVSAATGYELSEAVQSPQQGPRQQPPGGQSAHARVQREGRAKLEAALERMKASVQGRAGP